MGTPASGTAQVCFGDKSTAKQIKAWIKKANAGKLNGDFSIEIDADEDKYLELAFDSQRVQNLEWQLDEFVEFAKKIDDISQVETTVSMITCGPCYNRED